MTHPLFADSATIIQHVKNVGYRGGAFPDAEDNLNAEVMQAAQDIISSWPDYTPTPLLSLAPVAALCGVHAVYFTDESYRFGLKSFKALGGAYAVAQLVAAEEKAGRDPAQLTITTATDGNHGRSLAWGAKLAGCKADAEAHGWHIVSDTSLSGYRNILLLIMAGYTLVSQEVIKQLGANKLTHCFLPIGVGGLAGSIVAPIWQQMNADLPCVVSVESDMSACFLEGIAAQPPTLVDISKETLMASLSCGEVSVLAWELSQPSLSHYLAINDAAMAPLKAKFADGTIDGMPIEAGECATSGLAALLAAKQDPQCWQQLELSADPVILLIDTEGATDAKIYAELTAVGQN